MEFKARVISRKKLNPIDASGVKVKRVGQGYHFTQERVPTDVGKLKPHITNAFKEIRKLKRFSETKDMMEIAAVQKRERIDERIANAEITVEEAKDILKNALGADKINKMDAKFQREFHTRTGRETLESGYEYGCNDVANVFHHLMTEAGVKSRIVSGTAMYTEKRKVKGAEEGGQMHLWNEVWNGKKWVPIEAGTGKIGFKPLEMSTKDGWWPLAPYEVSEGQVIGRTPKLANPFIHEISDKTKEKLTRKKIKFSEPS